MAQTMYDRPWPRWLPAAVIAPLTVVLVALAIKYGAKSSPVWIILAIELLALVVLTIFDPEVTIETLEILADGIPVKVRRPIVGFKRLERKVGVTGGYEVRVDGYRYEEAYIRL